MNGRPMMPNLWMTYNMMIEIDAIKPVSDPKGMMQRHFVEPTLKYTNAALRELGELPDPETERLAKSPLPYLEGPIEQYLGPWERT